jgi:hypothetical protein
MDVIARIKQFAMYSDKQHAMYSHELQSALISRVGFSKMYYTR